MSESLIAYRDLALQLFDQFDEYDLSHVPRSENREANAMAQATSELILLCEKASPRGGSIGDAQNFD